MIFENHHIAHRNIVSKLYNFVPEEIQLAVEDFDKILTDHGYHPNGKMFFSMMSDPRDEVITAEIFLQIEEDYCVIPDEHIFFHSYFCVSSMLMTRITEDFQVQSQVKYWELVDYFDNHNIVQLTPVFVEYKTDPSGKHYVEMSVGYGLLPEENS